MLPPRDAASGRRLYPMIARFTGGERWVHWATAALLGVCLLTAVVLYVGQLQVLIGRRRVIELVHVYSGFGLPVPMLLGWLSRAFRQDLRRLNRFSPQDWQWLRSRDRRSGRIVVGKFNAGQKLNGAFTAGSILVMLGSGVMLFWPNQWPLSLRIGATFVHDWLALAILAVVLGHTWYAVRDPEALHSMRTGQVPRWWAARNHPGWLAELDGAAAEPAEPAGAPSDPVNAARPADSAPESGGGG